MRERRCWFRLASCVTNYSEVWSMTLSRNWINMIVSIWFSINMVMAVQLAACLVCLRIASRKLMLTRLCSNWSRISINEIESRFKVNVSRVCCVLSVCVGGWVGCVCLWWNCEALFIHELFVFASCLLLWISFSVNALAAMAASKLRLLFAILLRK